ncbi:MAG: hypothetical protein RMY30_036270 [Nostoc sp. CmiSLP01]|nr:hypothetical protein [Nostoc sp. CmiSLP01]MDZ8282013.1 hypothetical protein [Nostoc sp. ChiSLP01]
MSTLAFFNRAAAYFCKRDYDRSRFDRYQSSDQASTGLCSNLASSNDFLFEFLEYGRPSI